MNKKTKLYAAYGSNMHLEQMRRRCPGAKIAGIAEIDGYELLFRIFATIEPAEGSRVPVLLWEVTEADEESLDRYEGYPSMYRKEMVPLTDGRQVMAYVMNEERRPYQMPDENYLQVIITGYQSSELDMSPLATALNRSKQKIKKGMGTHGDSAARGKGGKAV